MPVDGETLILGISIGILGAFPLLAAFFVLYQRYTKAAKRMSKLRDLESGEFKPPIPGINYSNTTLSSTIPSSRNEARSQGRSESRSPARNETRNHSRCRPREPPNTRPWDQPKILPKNEPSKYHLNPFIDPSRDHSSRNVSRTDSRNESRTYSRGESRAYSRNESRNASRNESRSPPRPKVIIPSSATEATYINDGPDTGKPLPQTPPPVRAAWRNMIAEKSTQYLPAKAYPPNDSFGHTPRTPPRAPSTSKCKKIREVGTQTSPPQTPHKRTPKLPAPTYSGQNAPQLPPIPKVASISSRRPSVATTLSARTAGTTIRRPSKAMRYQLKSLVGSVRSRWQPNDSPVSPCQSSVLRYARTPYEASPRTPFSFAPKTPKETPPDIPYDAHNLPQGYPMGYAELPAQRSSGSAIDSSETDASSRSSLSTELYDRSLDRDSVRDVILIGVEDLGGEGRLKH